MNGFSFLLFVFALFFLWRGSQGSINKMESKRHRSDEFLRTISIVERDPSNSGTRAKLAAFLIEEGDLEAGIHEYRTAIANSPHGPFTTQWKRNLRDALETQATLERGDKIEGFNDWRVCNHCQAKVATADKSCPRCGAVLRMNALEWFLRGDTQREIWRESVPIALVLWICAIIFAQLPLEWKGTLIISSLLVGGWLIIRSFDK
ncbi:MAG TPA: zinc ribbon domain-containing protein [Abditibacterium sp.]